MRRVKVVSSPCSAKGRERPQTALNKAALAALCPARVAFTACNALTIFIRSGPSGALFCAHEAPVWWFISRVGILSSHSSHATRRGLRRITVTGWEFSHSVM